MTKEKSKFSGKLAVIVATVGSSIGLGNVWRFPSEAQANGGATFLVVYILSVLILGIPVMLAEFSLGRAGGSDSVGNFKNLTPNNKWWLAGILGLLASYVVLSYYMVVAGWTLEYFFNSATGALFDGYQQSDIAHESKFFTDRLNTYVASAWEPLKWTYIMIALNLAILLAGVKKGIEKISNLLMPIMFAVMIFFCVVALMLPNAKEGVEFFLFPDMKGVNAKIVVNALGQAFFSLSLGMGVLVTYSSYYPKETNLTRTATSVASLDFLMAFVMGLIIFPAVTCFGIGASAGQVEGQTLVFITMPEIFGCTSLPRIWASLFFLLLAIAALTSTISLAEVAVAFMRDRFHLSRTWACIVVLVPMIVTSSLCSLSLGTVPELRIGGMSLFDALDTFTTNLLLPLSALSICIYVGWVLPRNFLHDQLSNYGTIAAKTSPAIAFLIRYICPLLIVTVLIWQLIN